MKQINTENNTILKILALALALILWFYVGIEKNPIEDKSFQVPVEIVNLANDRSATLSVSTVQVTARGRLSRLNAIGAKDFHAIVDMKGKDNGEYSVEVQVKSPSRVHSIKVFPSTVTAYVEQKEGQYFDVTLKKEGMLPSGIELESATTEPTRVFISGHTMDLGKIAGASVTLHLDTIERSQSIKAKVELFNQAGEKISPEGIEIFPDEVTLKTKVKQNKAKKSIPIKADFTNALPNGLTMTDVEINPSTLEVEGEPNIINNISSLKTAPIDLSTITEDSTLEVGVQSSGVTVKSKVHVTIHVKRQEITYKTLKIPLALNEALKENYTLTQDYVSVSYHFNEGEQDRGDQLQAFINNVSPQNNNAKVEITGVEGLVIDQISPETVKLTKKE